MILSVIDIPTVGCQKLLNLTQQLLLTHSFLYSSIDFDSNIISLRSMTHLTVIDERQFKQYLSKHITKIYEQKSSM